MFQNFVCAYRNLNTSCKINKLISISNGEIQNHLYNNIINVSVVEFSSNYIDYHFQGHMVCRILQSSNSPINHLKII